MEAVAVAARLQIRGLEEEEERGSTRPPEVGEDNGDRLRSRLPRDDGDSRPLSDVCRCEEEDEEVMEELRW